MSTWDAGMCCWNAGKRPESQAMQGTDGRVDCPVWLRGARGASQRWVCGLAGRVIGRAGRQSVGIAGHYLYIRNPIRRGEAASTLPSSFCIADCTLRVTCVRGGDMIRIPTAGIGDIRKTTGKRGDRVGAGLSGTTSWKLSRD